MKYLRLAAWPPYFNALGVCSLADAEVGTQIALRKIAATAGDFPDLRETPRHHTYPCPHRIAITFVAEQLKVEKVIAAAAAIVQEHRWVSIVCHHHIHMAGVIEICECYTTAHVRRLKPGACRFRCLEEFAIAFVVKQRIQLLEVNLRRRLFYFWIDMAIRNE